jgi:prepilin-type N-terminal cleavage/methylation domain-containing protein/prepilin-type processing-associated H-X9-DG protein
MSPTGLFRLLKLLRPSPRGGFTLLELVVVIAVIAILTAIAFPVTSRVIQAERASACVSNLRQLGAALQLYLGEHNQVMPTLQAGRTSVSQNVPVIDNTLNTYAPDPRIFACPADNLGIAAATGTSYFWNSGLNGQSATNLRFLLLAQPGQNAEIPVLSDKQGFHPYASNKVNILYADGHASQDLIFTTSQ